MRDMNVATLQKKMHNPRLAVYVIFFSAMTSTFITSMNHQKSFHCLYLDLFINKLIFGRTPPPEKLTKLFLMYLSTLNKRKD